MLQTCCVPNPSLASTWTRASCRLCQQSVRERLRGLRGSARLDRGAVQRGDPARHQPGEADAGYFGRSGKYGRVRRQIGGSEMEPKADRTKRQVFCRSFFAGSFLGQGQRKAEVSGHPPRNAEPRRADGCLMRERRHSLQKKRNRGDENHHMRSRSGAQSAQKLVHADFPPATQKGRPRAAISAASTHIINRVPRQCGDPPPGERRESSAVPALTMNPGRHTLPSIVPQSGIKREHGACRPDAKSWLVSSKTSNRPEEQYAR